MANDGGPSMGEYEEGLADPPAPEEQSVGELAAMIRRCSLVAVKSAFMIAELEEGDFGRAAAYKAVWTVLKPHAEAEVEIARRLVEAAAEKAR